MSSLYDYLLRPDWSANQPYGWQSAQQDRSYMANQQIGADAFAQYANAYRPPGPKRTEPSAYLMPRPGQPRLRWVPAANTDIRRLFRRVRKQMEKTCAA